MRVRVRGTVQGVGFRPYVYRLAGELELGGYVFNDAHGVVAEVEGAGAQVEAFLARLGPEAPPLAVVEQVATEERPVCRETVFTIRESPRGERPDAPITPDTAVCPDCLRELRDPADRRFRYPFINCTNCGPRFTIVRGVPYDRPLTTMASFVMCAACRTEYEDPGDRRFHAQPNACPVCGPRASLVSRDGEVATQGGAAPDAVTVAAAALRDGAILAVKGVGGYHLACRADDETAVAALRARKHREDKPFALMVADLAEAERLVDAARRRAGAARVARAPDRARQAPGRRAGGRRGGARCARAGRDAALLPPAPPAAGRCRRRAGDDERKRVRRADRLSRRRRPPAAGGDRGPVPRPRPADRDPHRRQRRAGRGGVRRSAANLPAPVARLRPRRRWRSATAGHHSRCWPAAPSSRAPSAWPRASARGSATTSATWRTTRRCARSPTGSATSSGCSRSPRRSSSTTCTPSTSRPSSRWSARAWS